MTTLSEQAADYANDIETFYKGDLGFDGRQIADVVAYDIAEARKADDCARVDALSLGYEMFKTKTGETFFKQIENSGSMGSNLI